MPAGQEPPPPGVPAAGDRAAMRKRMRRLRRTREVLLRELGALVVEMRRLGRSNPELVERKAGELVALDEELRGLRTALGERQTVETLVAAGVVGGCARCSTLLGSDDRFCSRCGLAVARGGAEPAAGGLPRGGEAVAEAPAAADRGAAAGAAKPADGEAAAGAAADEAVPIAGTEPPTAPAASSSDGNGGAPGAAPPPPPPPPAPELTSSAPRQS